MLPGGSFAVPRLRRLPELAARLVAVGELDARRFEGGTYLGKLLRRGRVPGVISLRLSDGVRGDTASADDEPTPSWWFIEPTQKRPQLAQGYPSFGARGPS
jgi:hypothetical protein